MKVGESIDAVAVAPNGEVWVSTFEYGEENFTTPVSHGTGVAHFDGQTWTTYTTDDGLAGNRVDAIAVTPDGVVWFGTDGGATRLDGETLRAEPQDEAWTAYTAEDGLA